MLDLRLKEYMVSGKLPEGTVHVMFGKPRSGKSIVQTLAQTLGRYPTQKEIENEVKRLNSKRKR